MPKARDLRKGDSFIVVGWGNELVLEVISPYKGRSSIKQCVNKDGEVGVIGFVVLAGCVDCPEDLYTLPITTEVNVVKRKKEARSVKTNKRR